MGDALVLSPLLPGRACGHTSHRHCHPRALLCGFAAEKGPRSVSAKRNIAGGERLRKVLGWGCVHDFCDQIIHIYRIRGIDKTLLLSKAAMAPAGLPRHTYLVNTYVRGLEEASSSTELHTQQQQHQASNNRVEAFTLQISRTDFSNNTSTTVPGTLCVAF